MARVEQEKIYMNGALVPAGDARVHVEDRSVLFGDSLFESVRAYRGKPFRLERHLARLEEGCRRLRMLLPEPVESLDRAVRSLILENGLIYDGDSRVRVTVTGGSSEGPKSLTRDGGGGVFITAKPYDGYPARMYSEGITVIISGIKRNSTTPLSSLKTGNYLDSLLARQEAFDRAADDSVMTTAAGNLAEATASNLFWVKDGDLHTPDIGCGFLPGVTREAVSELCLELGIPLKPVMVGPEALLDADEAFLTNSLMELMPVRRVVQRRIGVMCPGPVTRKLSAAYGNLVSRELDL